MTDNMGYLREATVSIDGSQYRVIAVTDDGNRMLSDYEGGEMSDRVLYEMATINNANGNLLIISIQEQGEGK